MFQIYKYLSKIVTSIQIQTSIF